MKKAIKLKKDIEQLRSKWDEHSQFKLKGVGNLSSSDLDTLELYAETYASNGGNFNDLMEPLGEIAEVLRVYGMVK